VTRFHINPESGQAGQCRASAGNCPFASDEEHYGSVEEARAAYETAQESSTIPKTVKKVTPELQTVKVPQGEGKEPKVIPFNTQVPEPTYGFKEEDVPASWLKPGDQVKVDGAYLPVLTAKAGYKYQSITVPDLKKGEKQISLELTKSVEVKKREETEASKKIRKAALEEQAFEYMAHRWQPAREKALARIQESVAKGYQLDGFSIGALVEADAKDTVMVQWLNRVKYIRENEPKNKRPYKTASNSLREELTERVVGGASRATSVSTSEAHNLYDRAVLTAQAEFVKHGPNWF
jgi:hypothetical protein